jgi:integrase
VSNRSTSARATRTGWHKDPVSREHHTTSQVSDVTEFPAPTGSPDPSTGLSRCDAIRTHGENPELIDAPTKTANDRMVALDETTVQMIEKQPFERDVVGPYMFSVDSGPANPDRIGWWWHRARELAGIDAKWRLHDLRDCSATTAITSGPTFGRSQVAAATRTRR